ncbi:MAG: NAD(P)H-dependent oxidoreductase [Nitrospinae bacterium]|nr:NAD(P)H-dependent oxidoreductase [Nitrospinota bacterium]
MPKVLIIQGSLNPQSKTAIVAREAEKFLHSFDEVDCQTLDLRSFDMQFCDGRKLEDYNSDTQKAFGMIDEADGFIIGMPVYCYSVSGPLKNLIDITSSAMEKKVAGILCTTGSSMSFLASSDLAKILAYESHVLSVQPVVCSSYEDFSDGKLTSKKVQEKLNTMIGVLLNSLKGLSS